MKIAKILRALETGKQLKIIDSVMSKSNELYLCAIMADIHMMALLNGKERTKEQFEALLTETGFRLESVNAISSTRFNVINATAI
ncbi:unnamed protein product [Blepharisma stoltei]|uniref:O-methyltransferase C-terminal domain-containing protein n=1 Tax=Blepharisma stoltei TaxID=1481888 RepID=A0AAU9J6C6_9CILI|nr:unnamed protein product [Blepharisma stoltei]